ncbi:MAG: hypothetical protein IPL19_29795 [Sandaracinaceae bacterium]|nr:hypothetical protein [Sandaracinaceae bacterium]
MTSRDRRLCVALLALHVSVLSGCWPGESSAPPPFDCEAIDRAAERFPDECGDAGVPEDAGAASDGGDDAGP